MRSICRAIPYKPYNIRSFDSVAKTLDVHAVKRKAFASGRLQYLDLPCGLSYRHTLELPEILIFLSVS